MPRLLWQMAAFISLLLSATCAYVAGRPEVRGLITANPRMDFGAVPQQTRLDARFELVNRYDFPITIAEVLGNCDCLETSCPKLFLEPGERTVVETTWDTGFRHGTSSTKLIVAYFRDPMGPRFYRELHLSADVVPDFDVRPASIAFDAGSVAEEVVEFAPIRKSDFRLSKAYCTHPAFSARLSDDQLRVFVSFDPAKWNGGAMIPELVVTTNSEAESTYRMSIRAKPSTTERVIEADP